MRWGSESRTQSFTSGADRSTQQYHAEAGGVWLRDPETGHGVAANEEALERNRARGKTMPGDPHSDQPHLFDPSTVSDIPFHAMSPHQFAASPHVWWHGRYGEDLPNDSYKEGEQAHVDLGGDLESYVDPWDEDEESEDKSGHYGIHFGTRQAALDRLRSIGQGRPRGEDESYELGKDPTTPKVGDEPRIPGRLFPVTLNHAQFGQHIVQDVGSDWRPRMGYDDPESKGKFYENAAEDVGSISAVVPTKQGRMADFFNSWNDHVLNADPDTVHPLMRWAAQHGQEHTGEDWVHPDDVKLLGQQQVHKQQGRLFQPYGRPAYLDEDYKNTLGPSIKVPG